MPGSGVMSTPHWFPGIEKNMEKPLEMWEAERAKSWRLGRDIWIGQNGKNKGRVGALPKA